MNEASIKEKVETYLTPRRFTHTLGVVEAAKNLALRYHEPVELAIQAALLHDCAKKLTDKELLQIAEAKQLKIDRVSKKDPQLLHGPVGAVLAKEEFGITDERVLDAIRYHTTGRKKMTQLEKIIYLADYIEPNRSFPGVNELRDLSVFDLDAAVLEALSHTLVYIIEKGELIHKLTVSARNDMLLHIQKKKK